MAKTSPQTHCQGRSNCNACPLRRDMVCSDVTLEELNDFHVGIADFDFGTGNTLFDMDTPAEAVYCIRGGAVKMVHYEPSGVIRIVRVLKPGDVAGLESTFRERYDYSAIALGTVHACRIPMPHFHKFIERHTSLQMRLMESSQAALNEAQNWLAQIVGGTTPARIRMARLLLKLRAGNGDRILRFTVEDMGAILGVTIETVSRLISEFRRLGILHNVDGGKTTRYFRGNIIALERIAQEG